jgi:hypothetical protein
MNRLREKAALPLGRSSAPRGWAGLLARGLPYSLRLPIPGVPGSGFRVSRFGFFNSLNPQLETLNTKLETLVEDSGVSQISTPLTVAGQQRPGPEPSQARDVTVFPVSAYSGPAPPDFAGLRISIAASARCQENKGSSGFRVGNRVLFFLPRTRRHGWRRVGSGRTVCMRS